MYQPLLPSSDQLKPRVLKRKKDTIFIVFFIGILISGGIFYFSFHQKIHEVTFTEHVTNLKEQAVDLKDQAIEHLQNQIMKLFDSSNVVKLPVRGIVLEDGLSEDARRFIQELNLTNPGENGVEVNLDDKLLTPEHKKLIEAGESEYGVNTFVSSLIPLNRKLPDLRSDYCKQKVYDLDGLPNVSIVIFFFKDPLTVLLRTIYSVLVHTPEHLYNEILLVDGGSDEEDLREPLESHCKKLKVCRIVRAHTRIGNVQSRVMGFKTAEGPIIVSLEGHMEVTPYWLEPQLARLKNDKNLVTSVRVKPLCKERFKIENRPHQDLTAIRVE